MIAIAAVKLTVSPRITIPNTAVWTVSVFEYAVPTAKFRSENKETSKAVAMIWEMPPITKKSTKLVLKRGSSNPPISRSATT